MVTAAASTRRYTIEDLAEFPEDGKRRELVAGRIMEWPVPNVRHNFVLTRLSNALIHFVDEHELGAVLDGDTMVRVLDSPFDARGADIAFYANGRFPDDIDASATRHVPDLVIEVISPSDRAADVQDKVRDWLRIGVRLLWYVNPQSGTTVVYQRDRIHYVDPEQQLSGEDVVPGFGVRLREILERLAALQIPEDRPAL